ncbi:hypothetical protein D1BOALGB6SA_4241 [Olavius sp. associated proteobacterium Delta 1]|nr:hypothetical protein D1BOALGB6SA_4241 [Olavius sp. associated proteobacterium Delta 1]
MRVPPVFENSDPVKLRATDLRTDKQPEKCNKKPLAEDHSTILISESEGIRLRVGKLVFIKTYSVI